MKATCLGLPSFLLLALLTGAKFPAQDTPIIDQSMHIAAGYVEFTGTPKDLTSNAIPDP